MGNSESFIEEPKDLIKKKKFDLILDVRSVDEWNQGHNVNAVNIPLDLLQKIFPKKFPNKEIKVLIYCRTGNRASQAVEKLNSLGYKNIYYTSKNYSELN